jgi:hypothetical protein
VRMDAGSSLVDGILTADQFALLVLLSLSIGTGVGVGRGWLQPVIGYSFISFWRGFTLLCLWSIGTAIALYLASAPVLVLMLTFPQWVPLANFLVLGVTATSFAYQAGMTHRATFGIILLFGLAAAAGFAAYFL